LVAALLSFVGVFALSGSTHAQPEGYSYTVGTGDGVTNLILDYAKANDKDISPARAYKIAQNNGQKFLDNNLTVESDLPFTEGIGAFETADVTIAASDNEELFKDIDSAVSDSPEANEDDITVPADTSSDNSDDQADNDQTDDKKDDNKNDKNNDSESDKDDEANDDEGIAADVGDGEDDENSVWPWIIGIAAVFGGLYYINQSREEE